MISKDKVYTHIKKTDNLPTLPEILLELLEACEKEDAPIVEIASIVSKDPALSLRVLNLVNSAYYSLERSFTSVEQAVVYLGANSIKHIAVTTSIHQVFEGKRFNSIEQFQLGDFWWHSLMCATFAKRLASTLRFNNPDEAYLSGLLHDIGRLVLVSAFPEEYKAVLVKTVDTNDKIGAETELIGITHCEAGSWLIRNWKMNSTMADAIKYHHESLETIKQAFPLVKIVYASNLLSDSSLSSEESRENCQHLLGLRKEEVDEVVKDVTEEVAQIADNLGIKVQPPSDKVTGERAIYQIRNTIGSSDTPTIVEHEQQGTDDDNEDSAQVALVARMKSITLLSGFLENLMQAGKEESILSVFEQAMSILFNINDVLFFLADKNDLLLSGCSSSQNSLNQVGKGMIFPIQNNPSHIVRSYLGSKVISLTKNDRQSNLADEQVLSILGCSNVTIFPVLADTNVIGVAVLGLPEKTTFLSRCDDRLVRVIIHQVGMCLYFEKMQLKKAEEIEAERMAAVAVTARKFAHEINNPLGIINNYLVTMSLKLSDEGVVKEELEVIREEIDRISSMINKMDKFSQTSFTSHELSDVNRVIDDTLKIVKLSLFSDSSAEVFFKPNLEIQKIMTSKDGLKQILINLLKNAKEAMDGKGSVEIITQPIIRGNGEFLSEMMGGVMIEVKDNGPGLPESIKENLFKPFVTTKTNGHSGLGLSIVKNTVKELGGTISCKTNSKEGTVFTILLPPP